MDTQADTLEAAIELSKGTMGLTRHIVCSELTPTPTEIDALCKLLSLQGMTLCNLQAAMNAEAGTQDAKCERRDKRKNSRKLKGINAKPPRGKQQLPLLKLRQGHPLPR